MTSPHPPRAPRPRPAGPVPEVSTAGHRAPALVVALLAGVGVWLTWWAFVTTRRGQLLDQAALDGARYGQNELWRIAEPVLEVISVPFVAVVLVAAMLLAVLQRRWSLALQVAVLMGGANLSTQVLKHVVLSRPDLDVGDRLGNALPSGHTTAAASVSAALLFVVPRRLRPAAAVLGVVYTCATGISTLVGRWHRPSDVVAAMLVVVAWSALASALGSHGRARPGQDRPRETHAVAIGLGVTGTAAAVGAAVALRSSLDGLATGLEDRGELLTAYGGGALGVVAVVTISFAALLVLRRAAEPRPAPGALGDAG